MELNTLLLAGLLGMVGQMIRIVVGLKSMVDQANALDKSPKDLFQGSRLIMSLMMGFATGVVAALTLGLVSKEIAQGDAIKLIALGYAGVDFLEGFISQYLTPGGGTVAEEIKKQAAQSPLPGPNVGARAKADPEKWLREFIVLGPNDDLDKTTLGDKGFSTPYALQGLTNKINAYIGALSVDSRYNLRYNELTSDMTIGQVVTIISGHLIAAGVSVA